MNYSQKEKASEMALVFERYFQTNAAKGQCFPVDSDFIVSVIECYVDELDELYEAHLKMTNKSKSKDDTELLYAFSKTIYNHKLSSVQSQLWEKGFLYPFGVNKEGFIVYKPSEKSKTHIHEYNEEINKFWS